MDSFAVPPDHTRRWVAVGAASVAAACLYAAFLDFRGGYYWWKFAGATVLWLPAAAFIGIAWGRILMRFVERPSVLRRRIEVAALLPTDAPITGLVSGSSPPVGLRTVITWVAIAMALPCGLGVLLLWWHTRKNPTGVFLVFTDDERAWLVRRKLGREKPAHLLAEGPTALWSPSFKFFRVEGRVGDYHVRVPRYGFADQFPVTKTSA